MRRDNLKSGVVVRVGFPWGTQQRRGEAEQRAAGQLQHRRGDPDAARQHPAHQHRRAQDHDEFETEQGTPPNRGANRTPPVKHGAWAMRGASRSRSEGVGKAQLAASFVAIGTFGPRKVVSAGITSPV